MGFVDYLKTHRNRLIAELCGTFILVVLSIGVHVYIDSPTAAFFTYAVGVLFLAFCLEGISGCHVNPAVSVGAWLNKEITLHKLLGHIACQIIGGVLGGLTIFAFAEINHTVHPHPAHVIEGADIAYMFLIQAVLVFIFVFLVMGTAGKYEHTNMGALIVGISLILEHLIAMTFTVGSAIVSVNPAIMIGSIFVSGVDSLINIWLYIVPSIIGAIGAGLLAGVIFEHGHGHVKRGKKLADSASKQDNEHEEEFGEAHE